MPVFEIRVFETDFQVHVDDDGTLTAAYTADDVSELLSLTTHTAIDEAFHRELAAYERQRALDAKVEGLDERGEL